MNRLNLPVEEFTTPDPLTATEDTSVDELSRLMKDHDVRHIPILHGETVVGIVSDRDLRVVAALGIGEKSLVRAGDLMARNPVTVAAQTTLDQVAFEMSRKKIGSVIVNEGDRFFGIFTVTDALNALIEIMRSTREGRDE